MKLKLKYKHIAFALLLMLGPLFSFGNSTDKASVWLHNGNQLYAKGRYADAIKSYRQVVDAGVSSSTVYYNLGNAFYKNGDIAWAVLYYEKAHKLAPTDDDININLIFARLKTADKIDPSPQFFITRWWHGFILSLSLSTLSVLSIVFILLASAALIWYLFAGTVELKKITFYSGLTLLVVGLIFVFMGNRQQNYFATHREAVIFNTSVSVKSAPAGTAKSLFVLHDGTKVSVVGTSQNWLKVKLPNGNEGWVSASELKEI